MATNIITLTNPRIQDREALGDFADGLSDLVPLIEQGMARLAKAPADRVVIADLFRAMHNIKGDAALCKVETAAAIVHPIESLLTRLRSGEIRYTTLLGEVILLAVDRLELATEALVSTKPFSHLKLIPLVEGMEQMAKAEQAELDSLAAKVVEEVTGFRPQRKTKALSRTELLSVAMPAEPPSDLLFFHSLALQLEARSPLFKGRTARILELARETNREGGAPVDAAQLEAAVYMHDVGMMFLPEAVWLKVGKMSEEERRMLHAHPAQGAGLLERMTGWSGAAEIVLQHHEMPDGGGYPAGLKGDEICPGAKILAIVDAFEAVTLKHSARGHKSSLVRAVAEINACDKQFAPEWIAHFNSVIRRMVER